MFRSAVEALQWFKEQGYPTVAQLQYTEPPLSEGLVKRIAEWALLVELQPEQGFPLHIYWVRSKPESDHIHRIRGDIPYQFVNKYPQIHALFVIAGERKCYIACAYPRPDNPQQFSVRRTVLTPQNEELMAALRYDPNASTEKMWRRIQRAIIGGEPMNARINQAFESFLAELQEVLGEVQENIKRKTDEQRFEEVNALSREAKQAKSLIKQVETLRDNWRNSFDASQANQSAGSRQRRRKGEQTPQSAYELPILRALVETGGRAQKGEVLKKVYEYMKNQLRPVDKEKVPSGKNIRWQNATEWCRNRLREKGYIRGGTEPGIWEITEAGRQRLRELESGGNS